MIRAFSSVATSCGACSAEPLPKNDNQLTVSEITTLNNVIEENQLNPAVVLNENAGVAMINAAAETIAQLYILIFFIRKYTSYTGLQT